MRLKYIILISLFILAVVSNYRCNFSTHTIKIKSLTDSSNLGFTSVFLFVKDKEVRDTITDIHGKLKLTSDKLRSLEGIAIQHAGHYPKYLSKKELLKDSIFYLEESIILKNTGGMGKDSFLIKRSKEINQKIQNWNKRAK